MSHVTTSTQPLSDTESDFDEVLDGDPEHVSIPGPSASKGELLETLRALQIQIQWLQQENKSIKEENKTLQAEKPKRKQRADMQHEFSIHEDTITIYARKYGMMVEMFPSGELLNKKRPESPTPFDCSKRYTTAATEESAFLDELYRHFPESLHKIMQSSYFSDLVLKSIPDARANEIKKLRGVAGDIFGLSSKYFTNPHYDRAAVPKIQQLLGVTSATNLTYKTFLPVLFPAAKVSAFDSGKQEDYTDAIDRALAALDIDSDLDVKSNTSAQNAVALAAEIPIEVPQPTHSLSLNGAIIEPDAIITTNANAGEVRDSQVSALDILEAAEELSQDSGGINSASGRGRAKTRGRKATPSGTNAARRGQSRK
ncbi:hypothetical protein F4604DRAFT_1931927 [Suillus subluteus]|nr:hypothetical protein F4604DRAFT_1931927 [Suillus subluteus]